MSRRNHGQRRRDEAPGGPPASPPANTSTEEPLDSEPHGFEPEPSAAAEDEDVSEGAASPTSEEAAPHPPEEPHKAEEVDGDKDESTHEGAVDLADEVPPAPELASTAPAPDGPAGGAAQVAVPHKQRTDDHRAADETVAAAPPSAPPGLTSDRRPARRGHAFARVVGHGELRARGYDLAGEERYRWQTGDVGEFKTADIADSPRLEPV